MFGEYENLYTQKKKEWELKKCVMMVILVPTLSERAICDTKNRSVVLSDR